MTRSSSIVTAEGMVVGERAGDDVGAVNEKISENGLLW